MSASPPSFPQPSSPRPFTATGRPTTSAGRSFHRPETEHGARGQYETTTDGFDSHGDYSHSHYAHEPTFAFGAHEEEEEEDYDDESSDGEDVFAFLPPTTADQQAEQQRQQQVQQAQQQAFTQPTDPQRHPANLSYPSPTFDPYARFPADSLNSPQPATNNPYLAYYPQPQTPPSTGSNSSAAHDPYQLKRLDSSAAPKTAPDTPVISPPPSAALNRPYTATTVSSREVHVSLPSTGEKDKDIESGLHHRHSGKGRRHGSAGTRRTGTALTQGSIGSESARTSYLEDDEGEGSIKMEFDFDAIEEEDSPYPEVRASVSNIDDPEMPAMTLRMWFVGLLLCMVASAMNVFFNFRSPAPTVVPLALLLISYPFGKFLAFSLPISTYRIPLPKLPGVLVPALPPPRPPIASSSSAAVTVSQRILYSLASIPYRTRTFLHNVLHPMTDPPPIEFSLNPGPWNIKEHVLVFIMANVAIGNPYAINAIVVSKVYYGIELDYWFSVTLVLATQLTGFGLAGMCRRFLVWPASMVWPQNLVACTLLNTLHAEEDGDDYSPEGGDGPKVMRGVSRYRFFVWLSSAAFFFFFLPGFLFEGLSYFSYICWAAPNNVPVNQMFGTYSGMGMGVFTFDWTQVSWIGSPLMFPWWAEVHVFFGFVLFYWILTPILYYTNSWDLAYFPISDNQPYDRFGNVYDVKRVLRTDDTFDEAEYNAYSPLYMPATYAVCYLIAFALSTCIITHTLLYHGRSLINGFRKMRVESDDIHAKLMRGYPEVPDWWYACAFATFFALAIVAVEVWHTEVPVWALLLAVALPTIYILPSGFIYAMTGQGITINILAQIIPGTLLPGNPLANMVFKSYAVQTLAEATSFVQDLKLGHYVKVPPRATFLAQLVSTVLAAFLQVGVKTWMFANIPDICDSEQTSRLTCPHNQVFYTASAIWGLIGPTRQFGPSSLYHPHLYAMIAGALLPLPFWFWQRRYPQSWVRYISTPVVLNGVSGIPPATGINFSSWFAIGFIFQYVIRRRNFAWWSKFNYVTSAALDVGTLMSLLFIFFTLQFPKDGKIRLNWWGNEVYQNTADFNRTPLRTIPDGGLPFLTS